MSKEINYFKINYFLSKSLFNEILVSNEPIEVMDYYIEGKYLYVFPVNDEIILPIDVIVNKVGKEVELLNCDNILYVYNVNKMNKRLYQYVENGKVIGYTDDYYIIKSDNIENIVNKFIINYEAI